MSLEKEQRQSYSPPCIGKTELFFPKFSERPSTRERREAVAKSICNSCEIREQCLKIAIENEEWGIWGGTNEDDRAMYGFNVPTGGLTQAGIRTLRNLRTG